MRTCGRSTISVAMLSALVTTVIAGRAEVAARSARAPRRRATAEVVVPPLKATTLPSSSRSHAAAAIRSLAPPSPAPRYRAGRSYATALATMPPWVRVTSCWSARARKSRRMVAPETPSRSTASVTESRPVRATASSSACQRRERSSGWSAATGLVVGPLVGGRGAHFSVPLVSPDWIWR